MSAAVERGKAQPAIGGDGVSRCAKARVLQAPAEQGPRFGLTGIRGLLQAGKHIRLAADIAVHREGFAPVRDAWLKVYRDSKTYFDLYELAEELVDLEDWFQQWRFRHMKTVERIIGFKAGTGGTAGIPYLRRMLDVVLFPELFSLRTQL